MQRFDLTDPDLDHLLRWVQDGVVTRRQLRAFGARPSDVDRLLRRKDLTRIVPGIFVNHTGKLTREQREWVAVLAAAPAALTRETVLPDPPRAVHVAVGLGRHRLHLPEWVVLHRTPDLEQRADMTLKPPRMRVEHALIDVMEKSVRNDDIPGAFAHLARTGFARTTPGLLLDTLAERARVTGRVTIEGLITDLRDGACSVLERGCLHGVERAHGLPEGERQVVSTATGRRTVQDVRYSAYGVVVELDGRSHHDNAAAYDADARRDLAELVTSDAVTARVTYGLVFRDTCQTAAWIAELLRRRGWREEQRRCIRCAAPASVSSQRTG